MILSALVQLALLLSSVFPLAGREAQGVAKAPSWPKYTLKADQWFLLNLPNGARFDASGLLRTLAGDLLTVNDRGASLYRLQFQTGTNAVDLIRLPDCFTSDQLQPLASQKSGYYDCEGIAQDELGRLYVCEEADRWILRWDPRTQKVERLNIDWAPVKKYFSSDRNASWEGIAIGPGRLYVANERELGRLIVVDLATLKVVDHFSVHPRDREAMDVHYTDLCWFDGSLYALLRDSAVVLKINPDRHQVLAEYDYHALENRPEVVFWTRFPTGTMEGLSVDKDFIWLVTDNNGLGRVSNEKDLRPVLFQCRRPDR